MTFLFTVGLCLGTIISMVEYDKHKIQYTLLLTRRDGTADMTHSKCVAFMRVGSNPTAETTVFIHRHFLLKTLQDSIARYYPASLRYSVAETHETLILVLQVRPLLPQPLVGLFSAGASLI